ncbi:MAG TPA: hypothetical protein VII85_04575 [Candidatus Krumholzibacteriaceae bacterium]
MSARRTRLRRGAACAALAAVIATAIFAGSCARTKKDDSLVLKEDIYGFFLGQTKNAVFKRATDISTITRAPEPPLGYRGELWNFSMPLEAHNEVDYVRCTFFKDRLMEIIVYFRDTSAINLDWLKHELEGQFRTHAVAEDNNYEMAQKTYRLAGPGMSITLRRITKKERIELYIQYLHDGLHKELIDKNKEIEKK